MSDLRPAVAIHRRRLLQGAWIACRFLGILLATLPLTLAVIGEVNHYPDLLFPAALLTPAGALWSIPFLLAAARIRRGEPRGAVLASRASSVFRYFGVASFAFGFFHEDRWFVLTGLAAFCLGGALSYVFTKSLVTLDRDPED